jgi:SlyX protein
MPQNLNAKHDESLEQVQSKIAYLEHAVAELSDVVFRQHKEIGALEVQLKALRERLDSVRSDETTRTAEQERPPHY